MESNQMFIKSYAELALSSFDDVYCIYLYRNPIAVLMSYARKCRQKELDWFLQSHWPKNILQTSEKLSFFENILWQWLEVRERYYFLKDKFKNTFEFDFRDINDFATWQKLFRRFRIKTKDINQLPYNLKQNPTFGDKHKTLDYIIDEWDMKGQIIGADIKERLWDYIEFARKITQGQGE